RVRGFTEIVSSDNFVRSGICKLRILQDKAGVGLAGEIDSVAAPLIRGARSTDRLHTERDNASRQFGALSRNARKERRFGDDSQLDGCTRDSAVNVGGDDTIIAAV